MWRKRVLSLDLAGTVVRDEQPEPARTDARETDLQRLIRTGTRPANDAVGTTRARVKSELSSMLTEARGYGKTQRRLVDTIAGRVDKHNAAEFKRVIGIDAKQLGTSSNALLDNFRKENVDLISSIPEQSLLEVDELLDELWSQGARVETLAEQILKRFNVSESRADLIARDQTLKLNSNLAQSRQEAAGITEYIWTTAGDERVRGNPSGLYPNPSATGKTRPDHFHLDGQRFSYAEPPVVDESSGRRAAPGQDYQCRCVAAPVVDFIEAALRGGDGGEE